MLSMNIASAGLHQRIYFAEFVLYHKATGSHITFLFNVYFKFE